MHLIESDASAGSRPRNHRQATLQEPQTLFAVVGTASGLTALALIFAVFLTNPAADLPCD